MWALVALTESSVLKVAYYRLGNDMDYATTPFECGLGQYVDLDADIDSLSLACFAQACATEETYGLSH